MLWIQRQERVLILVNFREINAFCDTTKPLTVPIIKAEAFAVCIDGIHRLKYNTNFHQWSTWWYFKLLNPISMIFFDISPSISTPVHPHWADIQNVLFIRCKQGGGGANYISENNLLAANKVEEGQIISQEINLHLVTLKIVFKQS